IDESAWLPFREWWCGSRRLRPLFAGRPVGLATPDRNRIRLAEARATAIPANHAPPMQRSCATRTDAASDLGVRVDGLADATHGLVDRDAVVLTSVAEAEAHGSRVAVLAAGDELEGHLHERV